MMMMAGGLRLVVACLLLGGATSVEELLDLTYPQREARYRQLGVIPFRDLTSEGMWASSLNAMRSFFRGAAWLSRASYAGLPRSGCMPAAPPRLIGCQRCPPSSPQDPLGSFSLLW